MNHDPDLFGVPADAAPDSLIGVDLGNVPEHKWAPLLVDLLRVFEALFIRMGYAPDEACKLASQAVIAEAEYFGGRVAYLPRGELLRVAMRDADLWRRYDGKPATVSRLAGEIGVSEIHMYAILAKQRALHTRKLQGRLFQD